MIGTQIPRPHRRPALVRLGIALWLGWGLGTAAIAFGQTEDPTPHDAAPAEENRKAAAEEPVPTQAAAQEPAAAPAHDSPPPASPRPSAAPKDPKSYGLWTLLPAAVAILLAVFLRQVVPALIVGILCGAYMMVPCLEADDPVAGQNQLIAGFRLAAERYVVGEIHESPAKQFAHIKIIVFTLVIGFTVGVIGRNGGTTGMVKIVAGDANSPRRGALTAWLSGLIVFFDDYANTMIVGPTMRPVFDRLKLSRAKLAYIVDSTAAPVSSIALIGTWIGFEISNIQIGIDDVARSGAPAFLLDSSGQVTSGMSVFLQSLAYRFYPILALVLVFLVALTGRDFGPMKRAERRMHEPSHVPPTELNINDVTPGAAAPVWWQGFVPIAVMVLGTLVVLAATGYASPDTAARMHAVGPDGSTLWAQTAWWQRAGEVLSNSDSTISIFYGAILAAMSAVVLTFGARACPLRDALDAGMDGMTRMFPAIVILVLAWAISAVLQDLHLGDVVAGTLNAANFPVQWLPLSVFISAAVISFATGTSWGTMGILCPMTVAISARLMGAMDPAEASSLFYAAVGSVLAGAVFGDHCSPISDTTVLSSIASGCRHEEHVWTQIPYALVAGVAAMGLGDYLCSVEKHPWYLGMAAGCAFLVLFIFLVGRKTAPHPSALPIRPGVA